MFFSPKKNSKEPSPKSITISEIECWLCQKIAETLKIPKAEVDQQKSFLEYGLNSIQLMGVSGDLEKWLDQRFSPTLLWDHLTIEKTAEYVQSKL